jgi:16S rRNA (guanine527-N7)-methyltransferase
MDVSRETPEVTGARDVFGGRLALAIRYAELLETDGVLRGLIGPREGPRIWERHVLNCAAVSAVIPESADVCDIGSGAGLPGLVLAIARPDLAVTLVEPLHRRTVFLHEAIAELSLDNVGVVQGKAAALHGGRRYAVVTSRAVAPLGKLLTWSMPLVASAGVLLAMKGSTASDEVAACRSLVRSLGCGDPEILKLAALSEDQPTYVVRVAWRDPQRVGS